MAIAATRAQRERSDARAVAPIHMTPGAASSARDPRLATSYALRRTAQSCRWSMTGRRGEPLRRSQGLLPPMASQACPGAVCDAAGGDRSPDLSGLGLEQGRWAQGRISLGTTDRPGGLSHQRRGGQSPTGGAAVRCRKAASWLRAWLRERCQVASPPRSFHPGPGRSFYRRLAISQSRRHTDTNADAATRRRRGRARRRGHATTGRVGMRGSDAPLGHNLEGWP